MSELGTEYLYAEACGSLELDLRGQLKRSSRRSFPENSYLIVGSSEGATSALGGNVFYF